MTLILPQKPRWIGRRAYVEHLIGCARLVDPDLNHSRIARKAGIPRQALVTFLYRGQLGWNRYRKLVTALRRLIPPQSSRCDAHLTEPGARRSAPAQIRAGEVFLLPAWDRQMVASLATSTPVSIAARYRISSRAVAKRLHGMIRKLDALGYDSAPIRCHLRLRHRASIHFSDLFGHAMTDACDLLGHDEMRKYFAER